MTKKKNGETEDAEKLANEIIIEATKVTKQMANLEEKVANFTDKYENFFNQTPIMIESVKGRLQRLRKAVPRDEYEIPFWEGYLAALLYIMEVVNGLDADVLDDEIRRK